MSIAIPKPAKPGRKAASTQVLPLPPSPTLCPCKKRQLAQQGRSSQQVLRVPPCGDCRSRDTSWSTVETAEGPEVGALSHPCRGTVTGANGVQASEGKNGRKWSPSSQGRCPSSGCPHQRGQKDRAEQPGDSSARRQSAGVLSSKNRCPERGWPFPTRGADNIHLGSAGGAAICLRPWVSMGSQGQGPCSCCCCCDIQPRGRNLGPC